MKKNLRFLFFREQVIQSVRTFFLQHRFHEVVSPVLHTALPMESNIYAFHTTWQTHEGNQELFLAASPEKSLKKVLAMGMGNCFSIAHAFRNLESAGPLHQPEFLMLEWYREDAGYEQIMLDIQQLISHIQQQMNVKNVLSARWLTLSLVDLFQKYTETDLLSIIDDHEMEKSARRKGYETKNAQWEQLFNQIFLNEVEPHLPKSPFFLIDFPARISPLCKPKKNTPILAERFEFFLNGIEIANGNTENTNAEEVKKHFLVEEEARLNQSSSGPRTFLQPIDTEFLQSLHDMQKKSFAGVGLGIDRLAMILAGAEDIQSMTMFVG